jgi:hypothetical protein
VVRLAQAVTATMYGGVDLPPRSYFRGLNFPLNELPR